MTARAARSTASAGTPACTPSTPDIHELLEHCVGQPPGLRQEIQLFARFGHSEATEQR
jgi:hypothetical protein